MAFAGKMGQSAFVFGLGMAVLAGSGGLIAASVMLDVPALFYPAFPLGAAGLVVAAVGLAKDGRGGRRAEGSVQSQGLVPALGGMRSSRDETHRHRQQYRASR